MSEGIPMILCLSCLEPNGIGPPACFPGLAETSVPPSPLDLAAVRAVVADLDPPSASGWALILAAADEVERLLAEVKRLREDVLAAQNRAEEAEALVGAARTILTDTITMRRLVDSGTPDGYLERYAEAMRVVKGE